MIEVRGTTIRNEHISAVGPAIKHDGLGKHKFTIRLLGGQELEFMFESEQTADLARDTVVNAMKA